jgi:hypothetical protein
MVLYHFFIIMLSLLCTINGTDSIQETNKEDIIGEFLRPVEPSQDAVSKFFAHRFNTKMYTDSIMPSYFFHFFDFVSISKGVQDPCSFLTSICIIFDQRLKACYWTNPYAAMLFLHELAEALSFLTRKKECYAENQIKQIIHQALLDEFDLLKNEPDQFLTKVSTTILDTIEYESLESTTAALSKFIDTMLSKLVWDPQEQSDTWECAKLIAEELQKLWECRLIPNERTYNNLLWTLLYRYGYFMECYATSFNDDYYGKLQKDLQVNPPAFLLFAEEDEAALSKKAYLQDIFFHASTSHELEKKLSAQTLPLPASTHHDKKDTSPQKSPTKQQKNSK